MTNGVVAKKDLKILRELARKYTELALDEYNLAIPERYRDLNSLIGTVRPPVLVFEEPWGELDCEELRLTCEDPGCRAMERRLRTDIFKCTHHRGDYALKPYAEARMAIDDSGYGFKVTDSRTIHSVTGSSISSHRYTDLLEDEKALKQFHLPDVSLNEKETEANVELASAVFDGLLPVRKAGVMLYMPTWDDIAMLRGAENCMIDLHDRPEYMHAIVEQFTRIQEHRLTRYEELNVLETDPYYLHCTPACTRELPVKDMDRDKITAKDVWCRSMAQAFSMVSPKVRDEFDLKYIQRLFDRCGLSYYGCCEPLHDQIPNLRKRFKNLRRISITPWADPDVAADNIGRDYVLSYKPNPAFVSRGALDEEAARKEIRRVILACNRNGTPFEFVLKDISTVNGRSEVLSEWVGMVNSEIDRYWKP
ncbi:MAG: hypothetical protein K5784_11415 [Clostridiales bacterium]|nr:hypothetical protein [Clostridiales bacterium]